MFTSESLHEFLDSTDGIYGTETLTSLKMGEQVELTGLATTELNGRMACLIGIGDDGRTECRVQGRGVVRVKVCNLKYPLTDLDVTEKMVLKFPELGRVARIEHTIRDIATGAELPCVPGPVPSGEARFKSHELGSTVYSVDENLVLTLWTVDPFDRVVASRVANVGVVDGRLLVGACFINFFGDWGWKNDDATWVGQWLSERC